MIVAVTLDALRTGLGAAGIAGVDEPISAATARRLAADSRRTDLDNLILLCPFHHRRFDHDGWHLRWHENGPHLIPPPHIDASRRPRRAGRPMAPS